MPKKSVKKAKAGFKEGVKSFFKPNSVKIIISVMLLFIAFYVLMFTFRVNYFSNVLFFLIVLPFLLIPPLPGFLLYIPYAYLISCVFYALFNFLKKRKWSLVLGILILLLLTGIEEPIVNSTINRPYSSCETTSDCTVKSTPIYSWCPTYECVNKNWEYYDSLINRVFALTCVYKSFSCSCVENKCERKDIDNSINPEDCGILEDFRKEDCLGIINHNIKLSQTFDLQYCYDRYEPETRYYDRCVEIVSNNIRANNSTNLEDCEGLEGFNKETCIEIISFNIRVADSNDLDECDVLEGKRKEGCIEVKVANIKANDG